MIQILVCFFGFNFVFGVMVRHSSARGMMNLKQTTSIGNVLMVFGSAKWEE